MTTPNIAQLAADLDSGDAARKAQAASAAATLGEGARPLAVALVRRTGDEDEATREAVVAALEDLGPPAAEDVAALAGLLGDPCAAVGYWAATLLGRLGAQGAKATKSLGEALASSPELAVRERSAWALGQIGPAAGDAREALRAAAESQHARLARLAREALTKMPG
jgi:HEAT repeat protein